MREIKLFSQVTTFEKDKNLYMCFRVKNSDSKDLKNTKIVRFDTLRRELTPINLIEQGYSVKKYFYRCPKKIYNHVNISDILADGYYKDKKEYLEKENKKLDKKISKLEKTLNYFKSNYPELVI